jgi:hypothetical protein
MREDILADKGFALEHRWDRLFFLIMAGFIWLGIVMGFGKDIAHRLGTHAPPYPIIVHVHAAIFVGWLLLFTTQILLIRAHRREIHKKLGLMMVGLLGLMAIIGPLTALIVDAGKLGHPGADPAFFSVQGLDILAFVGLASAGIILRRHASAHKRLMLMSTLYISNAGYARWFGDVLGQSFGFGFWGALIVLYLISDLLLLGVGVYDLITRRRLHPAYVVGLIYAFGLQLLASALYHWPDWKLMATALMAPFAP